MMMPISSWGSWETMKSILRTFHQIQVVWSGLRASWDRERVWTVRPWQLPGGVGKPYNKPTCWGPGMQYHHHTADVHHSSPIQAAHCSGEGNPFVKINLQEWNDCQLKMLVSPSQSHWCHPAIDSPPVFHRAGIPNSLAWKWLGTY